MFSEEISYRRPDFLLSPRALCYVENGVALQGTAAMLASMTLSIKIDNMDDAQLSIILILCETAAVTFKLYTHLLLDNSSSIHFI